MDWWGTLEAKTHGRAAWRNLLSKTDGARLAQPLKGSELRVCNLAYVELAAILAGRLDEPFGSFSDEERAAAERVLALETPQWRVTAWLGGCKLERAEISLERLLRFCREELRYSPEDERFECLKAPCFSIGEPCTARGPWRQERRLDGLVKGEPVIVTAPAFARMPDGRHLTMCVLHTGVAHDCAKHTRAAHNCAVETCATHIRTALAPFAGDEVNAVEALNRLFGRVHRERLATLQPWQLSHCGLDYEEVAAVLCKYLVHPLGRPLQKAREAVQAVLEPYDPDPTTTALRADTWLVACKLRHSRVPVRTLAEFCTALGYEGNAHAGLECYKRRHWLPRRANAASRVSLNNWLCRLYGTAGPEALENSLMRFAVNRVTDKDGLSLTSRDWRLRVGPPLTRSEVLESLQTYKAQASHEAQVNHERNDFMQPLCEVLRLLLNARDLDEGYIVPPDALALVPTYLRWAEATQGLHKGVIFGKAHHLRIAADIINFMEVCPAKLADFVLRTWTPVEISDALLQLDLSPEVVDQAMPPPPAFQHERKEALLNALATAELVPAWTVQHCS
ncbi:hypothetical protein GNI_109110 [Gregarina niphandrodes]|uniref:Uncharacterized protein n=1 Tax=Gregarina niphandrodes TaxID=110365 RepID=A0A023B3N8_GRENI|nr:hypothetical protein GNI_109110 [Gregarina niphandrodes]EZG55738.1 hypothetical protein GNI_109110 [Gregarina niphandrodes]|eukprot:XP_011131449.1 hypothetical protein GNI_109110 [Gregarina niphandrodes]